MSEQAPKKPGPVWDASERDVRVSLWINEGKNGPFPSLLVERRYKTDGEGKTQRVWLSERSACSAAELIARGLEKVLDLSKQSEQAQAKANELQSQARLESEKVAQKIQER